MTPVELIAFEQRVAEAFNAGRIRAPVHLAGGNEDDLIAMFANIRLRDWVATQWRSHYHCLLKGVPPERLMRDILAGHSITLTYPEHRIISSAIVGGVLPIALGIAWAIKRADRDELVWAFVGDMTAKTGIFHEVATYAAGHKLPLNLIIENNGKSVCTDTQEVWGKARGESLTYWNYDYDLPWPHAGAGQRVQF